MVLFSKQLKPKITLQKSSKYFIWCQIDKSILGTDKHLYLCGAYIPPENSRHFSLDLFEELENEIANFRSKGLVMLLGDLNARTSKLNDFNSPDGNRFLPTDLLEKSQCFSECRNNLDNTVNNHGKNVLNICKQFDIRIVNGRFRGDSLGNFTFHNTKGDSTLDYIICDQNLFSNIEYFLVQPSTYLSDHNQIILWIKIPSICIDEIEPSASLSEQLEPLPSKYIWNEDSYDLFKSALKSKDCQLLIDEFLSTDFEESQRGIDFAVQKVQAILLEASKRSLKRKVVKRRRRISHVIKKKWFDKECRLKRHEVRKLANLKHRDPMNSNVREEFKDKLKEYRTLLKTKQNRYRDDKLNQLSESDKNSKTFWDILKSVPETIDEESTPPVEESEWLNHFGKLHSSPSELNSQQRHVLDKLKLMEKESVNYLCDLDFIISDEELKASVKSLKYKKACYSDLIKNEMIKASYGPLINVYLTLFNLILHSGFFPSVWCEGLITPIFKSGDKSKPGNYRGICISSCLGKLFTCILNRRITEHISSKGLLHPSQIGFMNENRTSDHIFTLRSLIEKHVNLNKQKIYTCFVDFKKAFDSVWHEGMFYRLLEYGIGGKIYKLIKSLYTKSICAVKLNNHKTKPFDYQRGVRQGCILSPILFNLFLNELPLALFEKKTDPFILPNGTSLNCLLYADDLVLISKSKFGLENCLKILESFNQKWLLDLNYQKTKILVFQNSGRKPKNVTFYINKKEIQIVHEYTYLGITFSASGSFSVAQKTLSDKAMNALFKIRKHVNLSKLKLNNALKIFDSVILPIITYGCEVWGLYNNLNFDKWDKTHMERVHLRFCKLYLELNRKTSNHAARAEMGRFPTLIPIIKRILKYNLYLRSKDDNVIVKQAFLISEDTKNNLTKSYGNKFKELFNLFNNVENSRLISFAEKDIDKSISSLKSNFIKFWEEKLQNSPKLEFYRRSKIHYAPDSFIDDLCKCPSRKDLLKLRTSNHSLFVETGRYSNPKLPREERICQYCDQHEVEDEHHLLLSCKLYSNLRDIFFDKLKSVFQIPPGNSNNFITDILSSRDKKAPFFLAQFINKCFSTRKTTPSR